jgi:hypothetical protein
MKSTRNNLQNVIFCLFLATILTLTACGTNTPKTTIGTLTRQTTNVPLEEPILIVLSFPDGAPSLNQTAELSCVIKSPGMDSINTKIDLNVVLPDAFQLISGDLSWHGIVLGKSEIEVINVKIKSIKTGNFTINVLDHVVDNGSGFGGDGTNTLYVAVSNTSAKWDTIPPWAATTTFPTENGTTTTIPTTSIAHKSMSPVNISLDISDLPQLGIPFNLIYTVSSQDDNSDINVEIKIPEGAMVVNGNLTWKGKLSGIKQSSSTIQLKFMKTGKYTIEATASEQIDKGNTWGDSASLFVQIGTEISTFGWKPQTAAIVQSKETRRAEFHVPSTWVNVCDDDMR